MIKKKNEKALSQHQKLQLNPFKIFYEFMNAKQSFDPTIKSKRQYVIY